ncbi:MAG: alginate export family protein [Elusimicrobia bacterium]|nr:alginate export family protein [Elusimicrobiota bacterium]
MLRLAVSILLSTLIPAKGAFAAATSPGGARVVPQDAAERKNPNSPAAGEGEVPERITKEHWAYAGVAELQERYGAGKPLPPEGCSKIELLDSFIDALAKVAEEFKRRGAANIRRDDMDGIRSLIVALEDELFGREAYLTLRVSIERLLALVEPPVPIFKYKIGVDGYARAEGAHGFRMRDLSYVPNRDEGGGTYRVKPYAYWHPNDRWDIHAEGQAYGFARGGDDHANKASLYQGFAEVRIPNEGLPGVNWAALKVGRQEFVYGSGFMLGSDTFFDGLSFDAARLRVQPRSNITLDAFAGNYATPFSGGVKGGLSGAYLTYHPSDDSSLEGYAIRDLGAEQRRPEERLDSLGLRSVGGVGIFEVESEAVLQSGNAFDEETGRIERIKAAGGHVDLTGQFRLFGRDNAVFIGAAAGTGDVNDSKKEFRNPNNDSALMGDMHVVGDLSGADLGDHHASGMQIYTVGWGIDLTRKLNLTATGRKFAATSVEDGFSRDIGLETDVNLTYSPNKDCTLIVGYDHFFPGRFYRDASGSGKGADYAFAMLVFNYDWTRRKR